MIASSSIAMASRMKSDSETQNLHHRPRLANFPFDPARLPFFYGTVVLVCGTLGVLVSAPGQTVGVSVFTDFLIQAHQLSRSWISFAYLAGTIAGAGLITAPVIGTTDLGGDGCPLRRPPCWHLS